MSHCLLKQIAWSGLTEDKVSKIYSEMTAKWKMIAQYQISVKKMLDGALGEREYTCMSKDPFKYMSSPDIDRYMSIANLGDTGMCREGIILSPIQVTQLLNIAYSVGDDNCKQALENFERHITAARICELHRTISFFRRNIDELADDVTNKVLVHQELMKKGYEPEMISTQNPGSTYAMKYTIGGTDHVLECFSRGDTKYVQIDQAKTILIDGDGDVHESYHELPSLEYHIDHPQKEDDVVPMDTDASGIATETATQATEAEAKTPINSAKPTAAATKTPVTSSAKPIEAAAITPTEAARPITSTKPITTETIARPDKATVVHTKDKPTKAIETDPWAFTNDDTVAVQSTSTSSSSSDSSSSSSSSDDSDDGGKQEIKHDGDDDATST
jgi:hypothetical protein